VNQTTLTQVEPETADGDALLAAFNAVREDLYHSLYFLLGNHVDAQDALQVAFLHCWRARRKLTGVRNVRAWIYRICLNAGRDMRDSAWRRRARSLNAVAETAFCRQAPPSDILIDREERDQLEACLHRLRPEEKEIFLLRQEGQLTFEEIAQLHGRPIATGKSLMRSALCKLQRMVRDDDETSFRPALAAVG
jgi:RNA polymerase sigma-70 factor (ECF subfamily)